MLEISDKLNAEILSPTQKVLPKVIAKLGDNRFLDNLVVTSGSAIYEDQILSKKPQLYWRFDEWESGQTAATDYSGNDNGGTFGGTMPADTNAGPQKTSALGRVGSAIKGSIVDNFTRSTSTITLGSISDLYYEYNLENGSWGIVSNQVKMGTKRLSSRAWAVINSGGKDGYVKTTLSTATIVNGQGLICRYFDDNNYVYAVVKPSTSEALLYKVVGGTRTSIGTISSITFSTGVVMTLTFEGNKITLSFSTGQSVSAYIPPVNGDYTMLTGTRHGMMADEDATSWSTMIWDNLEIVTDNNLDYSYNFGGAGYIYKTGVNNINTDDFTVNFWASKTNNTGTQVAVSKDLNNGSTAANTSYRIYTSSTAWYFDISDGSSVIATNSGATAGTATWQMITMTRSGNLTSFYVDGALVKTITSGYNANASASNTFRAGSGFTNTANYFNGDLDEISVFDKALSAYEILGIYKSGVNTGSLATVENACKAEDVFHIYEEETYPWAIFGSYDEYGNLITANGLYKCLRPDDKWHGWWTRSKSNGSASFGSTYYDTTYAEFSPRLVNKFELSTGYQLGRLNQIKIEWRNAETGAISNTTETFTSSTLEYYLAQDTLVDLIILTPLSTTTISDYGRLYHCGVVYEADISDDVVVMGVEKTREELETTLPIGLLSTNTGSIEIDNTDKKYSPYSDSDYAPFIRPDVAMNLSLAYEFDDETTEEVQLQSALYVDDWAVESSMIATANLTDWSKFLQEESAPTGRVYENTTAGYAITDIARASGYPSRKVFYYDTFPNVVSGTRPKGYWRLSNTSGDSTDECGTQHGLQKNKNNLGKTPLLPQELDPIIYVPERSDTLVPKNTSNINKQPAYSTYFNAPVTAQSDDFNRANSSTTLGSPWVVQGSSVWGITSNQAYLVTSDGTNRSIVTVPSNTGANTMHCDLVSSVNNAGLVLNYIDNDNYLWIYYVSAFATWNIMKRVSGVDTLLSNTGLSGASPFIEMSYDSSNSMYYVRLDQALRSFEVDSVFATGNKCGLLGPVTGGAAGMRWDNFKVSGLSSIIDITNASNYGTSQPFSFGTNFSVQAVFQMVTPPTSGNRAVLVNNGFTDDNTNYSVWIEPSGANYVLVGGYYASSAFRTVTSQTFSQQQLAETNHVIFVRDTNTATLYLNGDIVGSATTPGSTTYTSTRTLNIGGRTFNTALAAQTATPYTDFIGYIEHVAVWDRALSSSEVQKISQDAKHSDIYIYRYLYYKDATPWDAMLEFATADMGVFYIDENGVFRYEYQDTLHEPIEDRFNQSQYYFNDYQHIIGGSQPIEIEANKVVVKVGQTANLTNDYEEIWRAEDGESLVVSTLSANITASSTTIPVTDTENPIFLMDGYVKIDNEIIKYNSREVNLLKDLERGQFDTIPLPHNSGALVREARYYDIEYTEAPAVAVKYPFVVAREFDETADIDKFSFTPFKAEILISANKNTSEGDIVMLEGTNPVTELNNYFALAGIPLLKDSDSEEQSEEVQELTEYIKRYRVKELTIDNQFIQDKDYAKKLANHIIQFYGEPTKKFEIETIGVPHIQLGDVIEISNFSQFGIINEKFWVLETSISYDGGINQTFVLRQYTEGI